MSARPSASTCAAPTTRPTTRCRPGERFGFVYEINYLRCIHCDLCVEACPTEAITESKLFEFSFTNRADAIYTKAELLVDDDGLPQQLPWEDWSDVDDVDRSPRPGCGPPRRRATPPTRARSPGRASSASACEPPERGQTARDAVAEAAAAPRGRRTTSTSARRRPTTTGARH